MTDVRRSRAGEEPNDRLSGIKNSKQPIESIVLPFEIVETPAKASTTSPGDRRLSLQGANTPNSGKNAAAKQLSTFRNQTSNTNITVNQPKQQQQQQQRQSRKSRNSVESLDSDLSLSSANDEPLQTPYAAKKDKLGDRRQSVSRTLVIGTRYVSPPTVDHHAIRQQAGTAAVTGPGELDQQSPTAAKQQLLAMRDLANQAASEESINSNQAAKQQQNNAGSGRRPSDQSSKQQQNGQIALDMNQANGGKDVQATKTSKQPVTQAQANKPPFKFAGICGCLFGSMCMCLGVFFVKLLPNANTQDRAKVLIVRGVFMMVLCTLVIKIQKSRLWLRRDEIPINAARAILGTCGIFSAYWSLKYISLGDSTALIFTSPIWTSLMGYFILGEPLQWVHLIALPGCIFGIVLVAHPTLIVDPSSLVSLTPSRGFAPANHSAVLAMFPDNATEFVDQLDGSYLITTPSGLEPEAFTPDQYGERWIGVLMSLTTSIIMSSVYIVLKFRGDTPVQTTTFYLGVATIVSGLGICIVMGPPPLPASGREWFLYGVVGFVSWMGQSAMQWALYYEKAGILSILRTSDVALTFILSALFLDDEIYWTSIAGSAIIGLVVVSIIVNNWITGCISSHNKERREANVIERPQQQQQSKTLPVEAENQRMQNLAHEHIQLGNSGKSHSSAEA